MKSSPEFSDGGMLLRSACSKCCEIPSQTTTSSRSPAASRSSANQQAHHSHHHYSYLHHNRREKNKTAGAHRFEPLRTSTPGLSSVSGTGVVTFGNNCTIEGILTTSKISRSGGLLKKVHFDLDGDTSAVGLAWDGSGDGSSDSFGKDVRSERTTSATYSSCWTSRTRASHNGLLGDRSSSESHYGAAMPRVVRRSHITREVFSSDEEEQSAADGTGSFSGNNCRPVYIIRDAAATTTTPKTRGLRPKGSPLSISGFFSRVSLYVWSTLYGAICSVLLFDAWLLSRFTKQQKRRICVLALLLLPLFLLWASRPSDVSSSADGKGAVDAATIAAWDAGVKAAGAIQNGLVALRLWISLPAFAWPSWSDGGEVTKEQTERIAAPQWRPEEEELRRIVGAILAEQLESRDLKVEKSSSKVEESLRTQLEDVAESTRDMGNEVLHLKTKIEGLGATTEELRLAKEELRKCCQSNADLLDDLDSKVAAAVLRELDSLASPSSESALRQWILAELSDRDSRLNSILADLRADVSSAAAVAREAGRTAEEAVAASAKFGAVHGESDFKHPDRVVDVKKVVKEAISVYDADKTGMADYALESAGGSVVNTRCTESYSAGAPTYHIFGIPIWQMSRTPRSAIQPSTSPGECWAFRGSQGTLVVQLAAPIRPTGFTVEHIPKTLDPSGNINSAPKEFSIMGLTSETDFEGKLLGKYVYREEGEPLQYFPVEDLDPGTFRFVEMVVHSNHGNLEYTCLYRLRVHGVPSLGA